MCRCGQALKYWQMKSVVNSVPPVLGLSCSEDSCQTAIRIKIKDNWNAETCSDFLPPDNVICDDDEGDDYIFTADDAIIVNEE